MNSYDIYKRSIMKQENAAKTIQYDGDSAKTYYEYDRSGEFESDISQIGRILFLSRKLFLSKFRLAYTNRYSNVSCFVIYIVNGSVQLDLDSRSITAKKGDIVILNNGKSSQIFQKTDIPLDVIILWCGGSLPLSYSKVIGDEVTRIAQQETLLALFDKMAYFCYDHNTFSEAYALSLLSQLFCSVLSVKDLNHLCIKEKEIPEGIKRTVALMDGEYDSDICIETLVRISGFSKPQYYRVFRESMGMTPYEYLLDKRICAAKTLLISTNYQIKLVASLVGYSSVSRFIEHFKKCTSLTPKAYRQQQQTLANDSLGL